MTNYDNAKVYAGIAVPGQTQPVWIWDSYGNLAGSEPNYLIADQPWVGFGLYSKTASFTAGSPWLFDVKDLKVYCH